MQLLIVVLNVINKCTVTGNNTIQMTNTNKKHDTGISGTVKRELRKLHSLRKQFFKLSVKHVF